MICVLCKAQQLTHKNSRPLPTQYLKYKQTPDTGNNKMKYLFRSQVSSFLFCSIYSFVIQFLSNDMRFNIINFCSFYSFLFHTKTTILNYLEFCLLQIFWLMQPTSNAFIGSKISRSFLKTKIQKAISTDLP